MEDRPLEIEPAGGAAPPPADARPRMPEPPPVKLIAVNDVMLPAVAGLDRQLDGLYVGLLGFWRIPEADGLAYQAENLRLCFELHETLPIRDAYRVTRIEVPDLGDAQAKLMEAGMEHTRQHGLLPGSESLLLLDPAGNWIELVESRRIAL